jgi:rod shape-determining protein MreB
MARRFEHTVRRWVGYPDLAVDVGTATTRLSAANRIDTWERPSAITPRERHPGQTTAPTYDGSADDLMSDIGRVSALRGGVVVDCEAAAAVIETLFHGVRRYGLMKPRVLACAPTDASDDERAALVRAISMAGASAVQVSPEPLAAAIGAGIDVSLADAQMVVDIGDGVTDIAIIQSGSLVHSAAIRVACSDLHAAVREHVARRYRSALLPSEAVRVTRLVGADPERLPGYVAGRATVCDGRWERAVEMDPQELWNVVAPVYQRIIRHVADTLRELPPSIACDVIANGVCLTGGAALLRGLAGRIHSEIRVDVRVAHDPLHAVINGARQMLSTAIEVDLWRRNA